MNHNNTLSLAIMSGKGGVGKTNIVLNLGYAMHEASMTSMLMDCDLGLANLDVLLGISPDRNLHDLLQTGVDAEDVLVSIEDGFDMLPATSGVPELVEMDEDLQDILFKKLISLAGEYDFLMLDLGAGISQTVLSLAALTQLRVVVVTPEPTSLTDSRGGGGGGGAADLPDRQLRHDQNPGDPARREGFPGPGQPGHQRGRGQPDLRQA